MRAGDDRVTSHTFVLYNIIILFCIHNTLQRSVNRTIGFAPRRREDVAHVDDFIALNTRPSILYYYTQCPFIRGPRRRRNVIAARITAVYRIYNVIYGGESTGSGFRDDASPQRIRTTPERSIPEGRNPRAQMIYKRVRRKPANTCNWPCTCGIRNSI